jgi:hypothetical protein
MSLWKVKFDHKNGETRKCKLCDKDFHTKKPIWRCKQCTAKVNFEYAKNKHGEGVMPTGKWAGMPVKKPYPFSNVTSDANNRFARIRKDLRKAWAGGRESLTKHYSKQLEEIRGNGIMEWILDRRGNDDMPGNEVKSKSKKKTNIEFPDTRGHYEY